MTTINNLKRLLGLYQSPQTQNLDVENLEKRCLLNGALPDGRRGNQVEHAASRFTKISGPKDAGAVVLEIEPNEVGVDLDVVRVVLGRTSSQIRQVQQARIANAGGRVTALNPLQGTGEKAV